MFQKVMIAQFHRIASGMGSLLNAVACLVSVLMLLSFPIQSPHHFKDHFRLPEVRRSIELHTSIAQPEANSAESVAYQTMVPALLVPVDTGDANNPVVNFEINRVPLSHMLLRLKLGYSRSDGQDPLL
jgi:hypothetical protein